MKKKYLRSHNAFKQSSDPRPDKNKIKEVREHIINMMSHLNKSRLDYVVQMRLLRDTENAIKWLKTELEIEMLFSNNERGK